MVSCKAGKVYVADWAGGFTRRLSCVSRTATPASTLPTVNEINMTRLRCMDDCRGLVVMLVAMNALSDAWMRLARLGSMSLLWSGMRH